MDMLSMWNVVLSVLFGLAAWVLKDKSQELQRVQILLNKTREEMAREYVTKLEAHADIERVMKRLDTLDAKLDRLVERT